MVSLGIKYSMGDLICDIIIVLELQSCGIPYVM